MKVNPCKTRGRYYKGHVEMQKRKLGKTEEQLSIIGLGGILVSNVDQSEADLRVRSAFDQGINYFDVAPAYGDAEERLGPALEGIRNQVFLACKTTDRSEKGAQKELHRSLKRLKTDHFDLYQLHAMTTQQDLDEVMKLGGALDAFIKARDQGVIRYIGFSAHSAEVAEKLMDQFDFDSVLFPINWVNYFQENFGPDVVKKAEKKNIGRLALKAMARSKWDEGSNRSQFPKCWYMPVESEEEARLALRFTLSQPITAAIPPGELKFFDWATKIASDFKPLTDLEVQELKKRSKGLKAIFQLTG